MRKGGINLKPILFNTEMVKVILDGRKTVTRRIIKPQPPNGYDYLENESNSIYAKFINQNGEYFLAKKPYMAYKRALKAGDILWVRETWCDWPDDCGSNYFYKATDEGVEGFSPKWRPSIHMPKEVARIFLKVNDVKVERLQDITAGQLRQEGLASMAIHCGDMEIAMKEWELLWNSTIKKSDLNKYGWNANPWVWVIEFEKIEGSEENG